MRFHRQETEPTENPTNHHQPTCPDLTKDIRAPPPGPSPPSHRLSAHPPCPAPAPDQGQVDAARLSGTLTDPPRSPRPDHPARRREPPLGLPSCTRRTTTP